MTNLRLTPAEVAVALRTWLDQLPRDWPPADPATREFCRRRLEAFANETTLAEKLSSDLGERSWRPLGHVLAAISENDHLGVVAALVAAALTGNRLTLKSRVGLTTLRILRDTLGLSESTCRIADWSSEDQNDVELLSDVDGILMAGSDALIRHYRGVAAPGVRLIEYGPRMSAAYISVWPQSVDEQMACIDALVRDTTLFLQNVCSSPQFILVPDEKTARALFSALAARLPALPPLPAGLRFQQSVKAQELRLLARLGHDVEVGQDAATGWAVTRSPADTSYWLPRGFRVIVGDVNALPGAWLPSTIQTLGLWPSPAADMAEMSTMSTMSASHYCRLGRMHERPLSAPHDGHLELAQWVQFVSCDTQ